MLHFRIKPFYARIIVVSALVALGAASYVWHHTPTHQVPRHKISFHIAADISALKELINAACNYCARHEVILDAKIFYYNNDFNLLKSQVDESLAWGCHTLVSIGNTATQMVHTVLSKRDNNAIAHLFACVSDPVAIGVSKEAYRTGFNSTGLAAGQDQAPETFVKSLLHVTQDPHKILIFYSTATPAICDLAKQLITLLKNKDVAAHGIVINNPHEVHQYAQTFIDDSVDAVITLRDVIVLNSLQSILKACRAHNVTAFASDSSSIREGAVAGCCIEEAEIGLMLGEVLVKIFKHGQSPRDIPVTYFDTPLLLRTLINPYEMEAQGLGNNGIYSLMATKDIKISFIR